MRNIKFKTILSFLILSLLINSIPVFAMDNEIKELTTYNVDIINEMEFLQNEINQFYDIIPLSNNEYLALSMVGEKSNYTHEIVKLDENFNVIQRKTYTNTISMVATKDENGIVVATLNKNSPKKTSWQITIDKLNSDFSVRSTTNYGNTSYTTAINEKSLLNRIELTEDGGVVIDANIVGSILNSSWDSSIMNNVYYFIGTTVTYTILKPSYTPIGSRYPISGYFKGSKGIFYIKPRPVRGKGISGDSIYFATAKNNVFSDNYLVFNLYTESRGSAFYSQKIIDKIITNSNNDLLILSRFQNTNTSSRQSPYDSYTLHKYDSDTGNFTEWDTKINSPFYVEDVGYLNPSKYSLNDNGYWVLIGYNTITNIPYIYIVNNNGEKVFEGDFGDSSISINKLLKSGEEIVIWATGSNNSQYIYTIDIKDYNYVETGMEVNINTSNYLEMTISNNNIVLDDFNGTRDFSRNVSIDIFSTANYDIYGKMNDVFRLENSEAIINKSINMSFLNNETNIEYPIDYINRFIKISSNNDVGYKTHSIGLMVKGNSVLGAGTFNTSFVFEAIQK